MNQERIGNLIKDIRKKNGLSQKVFAEKYGVTYQAVSKWENGKNIPDLAIIKQICADYDISIDELLDGTTRENIKNNKLISIILFLIGVILIVLGLLFLTTNESNNDFEFKTLSSLSAEFSLTGSIAYNDDKTSIYISDISYVGQDRELEYKEIKSILYEVNGKSKQELGTYDKTFLISFEEYVKTMTFNINNHASICKEYTEESLLLEISAVTKDDKIIKYEIPISVSDNCKK